MSGLWVNKQKAIFYLLAQDEFFILKFKESMVLSSESKVCVYKIPKYM